MKLGQTREYKEKFKKAVELYKNGKRTTEISRLLKMDIQKLRNNLRDFGLIVKDLNYNETINHFAFSKIETEEQAYWLGLLYADGYVAKDSNRIELTLKDREHVEKFSKFLKIGEGRVKAKIAMKKEYYRLCFSNFQLHRDLIINGCIPQKSLTLTFPNNATVPNSLVNHFVRGYFDGDGSLGIYANKGVIAPQFSINGTKDFLDKLVLIYNLPKNKYGRDGKAFRYTTVNKKSVNLFLSSLYKNSNISLNRKYKIFIDCRFE